MAAEAAAAGGGFNPWVYAGLTIGGAIVGDWIGGSGAGAADRAAAEQLAFAKELYAKYEERWGPLEIDLLKDLRTPVEEQRGTQYALSQIDKGVGDARGNLRRAYAGRYPAGSNLEAA